MGGCSDAKVTIMVLNVDLDCCPCYWKVKKLLSKFPQIRDQVFDDKNNTVTITVVCCSPDKIKDKLSQKAGKSIKAITIKESKKQQDKSKDKDEKPKSKGDDKKDDKPKGDGEKPKSKSGDDNKDQDKEKGSSKNKESPAPAPAPAAAAAQVWMAEPEAQWVPGYPPQVYPVTVHYGGPSNCYQGLPVAPPYYHNHQGYAYSYAPQPPYHANRSDYFTDENPGTCSIM